MWRPALNFSRTVFSGGSSLWSALRPSGNEGPLAYFPKIWSLHFSSHQLWSQEDEQKLLDLDAAGVQLKDMVEMFPGRSRSALANRRYLLQRRGGLGRSKLNVPGAPFTEGEDELIGRMRSDGHSFKAIAALLPHRSLKSIWTRARRLRHGISDESRSPHKYSDEEKSKIRHLRQVLKLPWLDIAKQFPGHSAFQLAVVMYRMKRNEGTLLEPAKRWTAEEEAHLTQMRAQGADDKAISLTLPGRTLKAVTLKRAILEIREQQLRGNSSSTGNI